MPLFVALSCSACWTTRTVAGKQLAPLMKGGGHHLVATALESRKIRIDPNAVLRFRNRGGEVSYPQTGRQLRVNADGVLMRELLQIATARRARVVDIPPTAAKILAKSRPKDARLSRDNEQAWELVAEGAVLDDWIREYVDRVARHYAPPEPTQWCVLDLGIGNWRRVSTGTETSDKCRVAPQDKWSNAYLQHELQGRPLGTWRFEFAPGHWSAAFKARELIDAQERGVLMDVGWAWSEIETAEVTNLSGAKSLFAIFAYSAAIATHLISRVSVGPDIDMERRAWLPQLLGDGGSNPVPMFSSTSRRRSALSVYGAASTNAIGLRSMAENHTLNANIGLRFADSVELGIGTSRIATQSTPGGTCYHFRIGGHLAIDADHQLALPISFDFGRGSGVSGLARLNLGIRTRLFGRTFVGLNLSPTALALDAKSGVVQQEFWLAYGLELGFTL